MTRRIAILGAGPIGIEASLRAIADGHQVQIYEQDGVGAHVLRWQHVRFFSPWALNRSPLGEALLAELGLALGPADAFPTGRQYLDTYLRPLASSPALANKLHVGTRVLGVARKRALKGDFIGRPERAASPFVLHLQDRDGHEGYAEADVVIDTTGVLQNPGHLGPGGLRAPGEDIASPDIARDIPDVLGTERYTYANRRVLVVGEGYSAATSLKLLAELRKDAPGTQISWVMRSSEPPYVLLADDPLPERAALSAFANAAARGEIEGLTPLIHSLIVDLAPGDDGVQVELDRNGKTQRFTVDRIIANVGYRPDTSLFRELQIHQCYASEGPMKLAAYLLSQSGAGGDCLAQTSGGFETLKSPEPDFFILGAKSYGRNSDFLLKLGFEQIEAVFEAIR
jgi:hypothetical protein